MQMNKKNPSLLINIYKIIYKMKYSKIDNMNYSLNINEPSVDMFKHDKSTIITSRSIIIGQQYFGLPIVIEVIED